MNAFEYYTIPGAFKHYFLAIYFEWNWHLKWALKRMSLKEGWLISHDLHKIKNSHLKSVSKHDLTFCIFTRYENSIV